ncbi:cation:proton antiporter [Thermodesulfobacterium sp.]|jgi:CPA2 family monovalent cation:H+ antiporter-2|uniref:cation:proton antiporter domain-containing protein n=1 Tax=Thermodesulfobacterium sp. TaxID=1965289 RepID=UPI00257C3185|nr:cation:proton antiporter [Thermodesulfobacterium sp.]MBZ4681209.1 hypothetical protein [Thermodesulfobacterium sp.]MDN5380281.1 monovalent cation:H+ antiporter-2, family [Thermodesulfobacterium sp.]
MEGLIEVLKSFLLIFLGCIPVVWATTKLKVPSVIGFLITGILVGPYGIGLLKDVHLIETLAEMGVIFLMFTIGIEFSIKKLIAYRNEVLLTGFLQVFLTVLLILGLSLVFLKTSFSNGVFYGFLVAMSSTALVLKMLMDRGEINSPYGRTSFGVLIFQDLTVVFVMLMLPILAGKEGSLGGLFFSIFKSFGFIIGLFLVAYYAVPYIFHQIVKTKSRELFLMTLLSLALGTAFFSYQIGLSLALGAFLAGLVISESDYAYQSVAEIKPLKDLLMAIFFVSIGLLLNPTFLLNNFLKTLALLGVMLLVKFAGIFIATLLVNRSLRVALLTTFYLLQIGEFSFVLALEGKRMGFLSEEFYQVFMGASIASLFITPFWIQFSHNLTEFFLSKISSKLYVRYQKRRAVKIKEEKAELKDHTIVVGFGVAGKNIVYGLKTLKIPYVILEMNPNTVKNYRQKGEPIFFGDATNREILLKFGVREAKTLVVSMGDVIATRKIVSIAKKENPQLYIIVRSKFVAEMEELLKLGANEVIPEEFEVSIEMFAKVLETYKVPKNVIYELLENLRSKHYRAFRNVQDLKFELLEGLEFLKGENIQNFLVKKGYRLAGKSIKELGLRSKTGVTIIAIKRGPEFLINPSPEEKIEEGDVLILIGKEEDLAKAQAYLKEFEP